MLDLRTYVRYHDFMDGAPFTAFRHTADAVLEAAGESVADPAVADVDCGIGLLTGLISRLEGFRLRLLRTRGVVDRTVLSAELGVTRGQAAQLARMIERPIPSLHSRPPLRLVPCHSRRQG